MKDIFNKWERLIHELRDERGDLSFFALAQREETQVWDLLIAAAWIDENRSEALTYLVKKVQSILTGTELLRVSGIILLRNSYFLNDTDTPLKFEETDIDLYGVAVKKAYIFITPGIDFISPKVRSDAYN